MPFFASSSMAAMWPWVVYESPILARSGLGRTFTNSGCWTSHLKHPTHSFGLGMKPPSGPEKTP